MFAPTKIWRKWHRKSNLTERRFAVVSAVAATALPALLLSRGHRVERVPEVPLVIDTKTVNTVDKTKKATALLKSLGAYDDVEKVRASHQIRSGKGKWRNRRYVQRRGPLVVYNETGPMVKAFRNIPGIELCNVHKLNLLQLAPGGHLGRFIIWTKDAFQQLDNVFGTYKRPSSEKGGFSLPVSQITHTDLGRIINSDEIQSALRDKIPRRARVPSARRNPLKNFHHMVKLNPYAAAVKRREILATEKSKENKGKLVAAKRSATKKPNTEKFVKVLLA